MEETTNYYYQLKPDDIIQKEDQYKCTCNLCQEISMEIWLNSGPLMWGNKVKDCFSSNIILRRKIYITSKGNIL